MAQGVGIAYGVGQPGDHRDQRPKSVVDASHLFTMRTEKDTIHLRMRIDSNIMSIECVKH
jgi:hypothetical protein